MKIYVDGKEMGSLVEIRQTLEKYLPTALVCEPRAGLDALLDTLQALVKIDDYEILYLGRKGCLTYFLTICKDRKCEEVECSEYSTHTVLGYDYDENYVVFNLLEITMGWLRELWNRDVLMKVC